MDRFVASLLLLMYFSYNVSQARNYHENMNPEEALEILKATGQLKGTIDPAEHTIDFWNEVSFEQIKSRLQLKKRNNAAKNVILFLGDGMSLATVAATRVYMGQLNNKTGEEQKMSWEVFPYTGLSKTYCVDSQVADSACTATAYLNGVKTNIKTIGVTADVGYQDWENMSNTKYHTTSIVSWAQAVGKGTGIVSTCKVTDASPAGAYSHTADRDWQTDLDILEDKKDATGIKDIASQLIEDAPGINLKVIMGGGRQVMMNTTVDDGYGNNGLRGDGKDLIQAWKDSKAAAGVNAFYVSNTAELENVDISSTDYLLGLFAPQHFAYHLEANSTLQPTLEKMTEVAIKMMQKEENGYFLFIEGGQIDHGHHDTRAQIALDEALEFHKAIQKAVDMTSEDDTLIVVTADHAHTMTYAGYPARGSDIFNTLQKSDDSYYYPTLGYANGPSPLYSQAGGVERNVTAEDRTSPDFVSPSIYYRTSETHDGQDVGVWARGPSAHLLVGNYEQTVIAHTMAYAARIGPAADIADDVS